MEVEDTFCIHVFGDLMVVSGTLGQDKSASKHVAPAVSPPSELGLFTRSPPLHRDSGLLGSLAE
ncbi:hypothetical protein [Ideonella paludis]|uniref:hypothetical protein n=1 Tax=Ideonella paludis TaxID=1233411 RepID=UPI003634DF09